MSGPPPFSCQELEDIWRGRTDAALKNYRIAKVECAKAISMQSDAAPPDGTFSYRNALRKENAALAECRRVLTIFDDLVIDGKMPPEE